MEKQDWRNKALDKDIIKPDNKVYSPELCVFIDQSLNNLLSNTGLFHRELIGGFANTYNKFSASCRVDGKSKHLGTYKTKEEASKVYCKFKSEVILNIAKREDDIKIKTGLLLHAELFKNKSNAQQKIQPD